MIRPFLRPSPLLRNNSNEDVRCYRQRVGGAHASDAQVRAPGHTVRSVTDGPFAFLLGQILESAVAPNGSFNLYVVIAALQPLGLRLYAGWSVRAVTDGTTRSTATQSIRVRCSFISCHAHLRFVGRLSPLLVHRNSSWRIALHHLRWSQHSLHLAVVRHRHSSLCALYVLKSSTTNLAEDGC